MLAKTAAASAAARSAAQRRRTQDARGAGVSSAESVQVSSRPKHRTVRWLQTPEILQPRNRLIQRVARVFLCCAQLFISAAFFVLLSARPARRHADYAARPARGHCVAPRGAPRGPRGALNLGEAAASTARHLVKGRAAKGGVRRGAAGRGAAPAGGRRGWGHGAVPVPKLCGPRL